MMKQVYRKVVIYTLHLGLFSLVWKSLILVKTRLMFITDGSNFNPM